MKKLSLTFVISDANFDAFARAHCIFAKGTFGEVVVGFEMHDEEEIHEKEREALNERTD